MSLVWMPPGSNRDTKALYVTSREESIEKVTVISRKLRGSDVGWAWRVIGWLWMRIEGVR